MYSNSAECCPLLALNASTIAQDSAGKKCRANRAFCPPARHHPDRYAATLPRVISEPRKTDAELGLNSAAGARAPRVHTTQRCGECHYAYSTHDPAATPVPSDLFKKHVHEKNIPANDDRVTEHYPAGPRQTARSFSQKADPTAIRRPDGVFAYAVRRSFQPSAISCQLNQIRRKQTSPLRSQLSGKSGTAEKPSALSPRRTGGSASLELSSRTALTVRDLLLLRTRSSCAMSLCPLA